MIPRCLFMDMNAFYASVEQQRSPHLRRRPVIIVPLSGTDATVAIAASYEAKALGIKTGTNVRDAKRLCPNVRIVQARPELYLECHAGIVEALQQHFVSVKVLSVDEMACRVDPYYATREAERQLAAAVKAEIRARLGPQMRCSIGIAPNVFLAKVASETQKPDGLTIFDAENLPGALFGLKLTDLPGIARRMQARLARHDITSVRDLWEADALTLRQAWGSIVGERWWHMLRGSQEADYGAMQRDVRKTVGHSHVLPPELRTAKGVRDVLLRLFTRALKRLRAYGQAASAIQVRVEFRHERKYTSYAWSRRSAKHLHANDDATWLKILRPLLAAMPAPKPGCVPYWAGIVFTDLILCRDRNLSLFEDTFERSRLALLVDALNARFGETTGMASALPTRRLAPKRIPYGAPD